MTALLAQSKVDAEAKIARLVHECAQGISDHEGEALALAALWQVTSNVSEEFREARLLRPNVETLKVAPKPEQPKLIRRLPKLGLLPISGPLPKPPAQEKAAETNQEPQIDAALKVFEEPQSKCEPVVPTGFTQSPTIAPVVADEGALCLDPAAPFDNAQKLVSLRAWHPGERIRTWQFWQKSFWQWSGTQWCEVDDDTVRASIWHELNAAEKVLKGGKLARYEPKMSDVNATLDALKAAVNLPTSDENGMPGWFGEGQLHISTRGLLDRTPRFWSPNALDIAYDPKAQAPARPLAKSHLRTA
jgi:hypothetical protein